MSTEPNKGMGLDPRDTDTNLVRVDVDSIEEKGFGVYRLNPDQNEADFLVGWMKFWPEATKEDVQYVTSAVAAALNDPTNYARAIRAKARREVRQFLGS